MSELGEPDGTSTRGRLDVANVLLELAKVRTIPMASNEVNGAAGATVQEGSQKANAGSVGVFSAGNGGGAKLDLASMRFHPIAPALDNSGHVGTARGKQHLRATGGRGLLGFVEGKDVFPARGGMVVDSGSPGAGELSSVALEHRDEFNASRERA